MPRTLAWILFVVMLGSGAAAQADRSHLEKLDLPARQLAEATTVEARAFEARLMTQSYDVDIRSVDEIRTGVLVRLSHPGATAELAGAGFNLETLAGDIAVGTIAADRLYELARLGAVETIEVSRMVELLNENGAVAIGIPDVHTGTGLPQAFRGQGVIMGVLDTGIDFSHPDFSDADGTRIEFLLDYLPDDANNPPLAQAEWSKAEIDADPAAVTQRDIHGHGTHVAGTAAGGGMANSDLVGVAPESRLIVVKGSRTGSDPARPHVFSERDIINGTAYIFERAAELDMPAVVNLSIGSHGGPLDGSQNVNVAMSSLAGEGRIIVFAGGNDGAQRLHWGTSLTTGETATMGFNYSEAASAYIHPCCGQFVRLDGWYPSDMLTSLTVAARSVSTNQLVASVTVPIEQSMPDFEPLISSTGTVGYVRVVAATNAHPDNGDGLFYVYLANMHDSEIDLRDHLWTVSVTAAEAGRVDAWVAVRTMGRFAAEGPGIPDFVPGDSEMTLNRLAAGHQILSAGAFASRDRWVNVNGELIITELVLGERAPFSSFGPTRDGRIRPDVVAPGAMVVSALSTQLTGGFGSSYVDPRYAVAAGTSMAAPFLSGTVALMLQINPSLTTDEVRAILHQTARSDDQTGVVPNTGYGYGKLDAFAAVQATLATVSSEPGPTGPIAGLSLEPPYPNPTRHSATLTFTLPRDGHAQLVMYDLLGREVTRLIDEDLVAGPHRFNLDRRGLAAGVYLVRLTSAGEAQTQRVVLMD